jgi:hypothetical protein
MHTYFPLRSKGNSFGLFGIVFISEHNCTRLVIFVRFTLCFKTNETRKADNVMIKKRYDFMRRRSNCVGPKTM